MNTPSALAPDTRVSRAPDVLMHEIDGEVVLLKLAEDSYFGFKDAAAAMWETLDRTLSVEDICRSMVARYDGDAAEIRSETLDFLGKLADAGLILVE